MHMHVHVHVGNLLKTDSYVMKPTSGIGVGGKVRSKGLRVKTSLDICNNKTTTLVYTCTCTCMCKYTLHMWQSQVHVHVEIKI